MQLLLLRKNQSFLFVRQVHKVKLYIINNNNNNHIYRRDNSRCCMMMMTTSTSQSTTTTTTTTKSHYETHNQDQSYDKAYFYEVGPYMEHLRRLCAEKLQLDPTVSTTTTTKPGNTSDNTSADESTHKKHRILLDIGGGTGVFTRMLMTNVPSNYEAIVIDPFLDLSNPTSTNDTTTTTTTNVKFMKASAEDLFIDSHRNSSCISSNNISLPKQYHQVLLKEVVHHFDEKDRIAIFHGIRTNGLSSIVVGSDDNDDDNNSEQQQDDNDTTNGTIHTTNHSVLGSYSSPPSLLLVTRPQYDIDYPLWDEARTIWAQNQPSVQQLMNELQCAGYHSISYTIESYHCTIEVERWLHMIRSRFWSTFANFTDTELINACNTIKINEQHRIDTTTGIIHFDDRLVFITASI